MGSGFSKMKRQAKQLEDQLSKFQEEMRNKTFQGSAGGGLVKVTINGEKEIQEVKINPECVDPEDIEGLEDLIKAAINDSHKNIDNDQGAMGLANSLPFSF